uniref:Phosphodiesterase n=1 Tax=Albugo laibachii Nc14 TaxID=890382 RepID=F0W2Y7_9STRA|nr:PhosphoDiEsterase family member (pde1) putative [Albugo laibachii Nc14]|eukprot:CCA15424.1 PhosphoDiEsterase family member (pde1) putative [Albugo laibachii Nc14]
MSAKKTLGGNFMQDTLDSNPALTQLKKTEFSTAPAANVQPKKQKQSRFFHARQFGEKRSRSVAPADSTTYNNSPTKRRKATDGGIHIREASALRRHYQWRISLGKMMQKVAVELFFVLVVLCYGIFVVIQITMGEKDLENYKYYIDICDITVGCILLLEILLNMTAFGMVYLRDGWTLFDTIVIVVSFILSVCAATGTSSTVLLKILRLRVVFRILRIVVVIERIKRRSRTMALSQREKPMSSPVERVLSILHELRYHPALSHQHRSDVDFAINAIKNNRLYEVNDELITDVDDDTQNWLRGELLKTKDSNKIIVDPKQSSIQRSSFLLPYPESEATRTEGAESITSIDEDKECIKVIQLGRISSAQRLSLLQPNVLRTSFISEHDLKEVYRNLCCWDFNIFAVNTITNGHVLSNVGYQLLHGLATETLNIPNGVLSNFLAEIQRGYSSSNPYHNAIHAADVMQTVQFFLSQGELTTFLLPLDCCLALIAAAVHDFRHDGFNNSFHINTSSEIAIRYNDHAVLENYHVAQSFLLMKNQDCNLFAQLTAEDFKYSREMIIQMVLATDMARHFEEVALFKTNILPASPNEQFSIKNLGDKKLLLKMILHTCDVSNPAKPRETMLRWTHRVIEEFFVQGDMEKQLNMPISPFMDRETIVLKKMQVGFADFIVIPLFTIWAQLLPQVQAGPFKVLQGNREFWANLSDEVKPHMINDIIKALLVERNKSGQAETRLEANLTSETIVKHQR